MNEREYRVLQKLRDDLSFYAPKCLKIQDKNTGQIAPFVFNRAQRYIHQKLEEQKAQFGRVRAVIVKGRQQGCSTYTAARYFHKSTLHPGTSVFILAHIADSTNHLFSMAKRYYENAPAPILPTIEKMNERRLEFKGINSSYAVGTAGSAQIGRGTTVRCFHGCLSKDSQIVLANGVTKPIAEVAVGDQVITSSGAIAPISAKTYTGRKPVFEISTWLTNETIKASADHKILTDRGLLKLADITTNDYIQLPGVKLSNQFMRKEFVLNLNLRAQHGGVQPVESATIPLDYGHGFLFGYYLAEGHVKKQWKYNRCCQVSFTYQEDEVFIEQILPLLEKYATSVKTKHIPHQHKRATYCYGTFFAELVNEWFGRVQEKKIPDWVFHTNRQFVLGLLDGYLSGDGSKTSIGRVRAPSAHERISRQLKRLVLAVTSGVPGLHVYDRDRYGVPAKRIHVLAINGRAYDELYSALREKYRNERFKIEGGQRFVKIRDICQKGEEETWDIEVDHPDHNFETPIGIVSNSEVAYWERSEDIAAGVMQAVPGAAGTEIILESTANGPGDWFHKRAMEGLNPASDGDFITIFVPWYWQPEYYRKPPEGFIITPEEEEMMTLYGLNEGQINWRRAMIADAFSGQEWRFKREYPCTIEEAFAASGERLISVEAVVKARKSNIHDPNAAVVGGCDPAREGDRTVRIIRRGREILKCFKHNRMDEMTCAGLIADDIERYRIDKYFVDVGCGYGTVDRLKELGYGKIVMGVHFGAAALQDDIFLNKRAEMADAVREWFEDGNCRIPDDDEFQMDMGAIPPLKGRGSRHRMGLPAKDEIKEVLGRSPDIFDALCLTFAYPVASSIRQRQIKRADIDYSRRNSPLSTIRDFNKGERSKGQTRTFTQKLDLT